ncbi:MAG: hypothetical protein A3J07_03375 [Candidatus Doudnabacteria bacterium RIFCSPLOWO2_02_FULL_49_13]|uniref:PEGA domain-containing protein n=1 Tax=Candidatus Doudnabacteria bacterium RIFCSPHIGHO2_12_FULL_48_16 TaxID=1817838 RepID=A0A1F5PJ39_9BACT|nr:MAG: hypothetical protein A3B77_02180 [Candidatus Doudnabacteria bacterium RIFCSPHIGHO2_02_FULL_49_24]OGE89346.1 MAG: hypothetical protein A2760_03170 [Candidatus Doudnabacteria bacterium RIFCSPHIGHO2_01_FULL_50_67]OGE89963.1 MAG: hypothetical protein A3E29_02520 [Candidatus Doudnabacteria bacterium RIFCSPHIGHO2_12_FULL_48_16]OGE97492.1 MAG: hypothetical protein A2990_02115 [Candidatus Doudnabacteria bacterium RIFCSPLOWO2_01_FULL_49_40]OGF03104.1 MAG: hypothetical protein A3J07_03375 [Candid
MNLKARFSLIGAGIIIFLIITPLLVLYARGFKYDFSTGQVVKTGTLVVKTDPAKAAVWLNGNQQKNDTPLVVRFLSPKDYEISVTKDGYQPWTKRLSVNAQYVTWAAQNRDYINLFFQTPKLEQTQPVVLATFSKNRDEIFFTTSDNSARSLNVNNGQTAPLGPAVTSDIASLTDPRLVWSDAAKIYEMMLTKDKPGLPGALAAQIEYVESNDDQVLFIAGHNLYVYSPAQIKLIERSVAAGTLTSDGTIWYVHANNLYRWRPNSEKPDIIQSRLPASQAASLLVADNRIFLTLDQTLYTINETLEPVYSPVTFAQWNASAGQLVYSNGHEAQIYNPNTKKSQLVLRSLDAFTDPIFNNETGYLFYQQNGQIRAIELDDRNGQNSYTIITNVSVGAKFEISRSGQKIYVYDQRMIKEYTIR